MHSNPVNSPSVKRSPETGEADALKRRLPCWYSLAGLWLFLTVSFTTVAFVVERANAQVPAPGLTVTLLGTNQLRIVITNGSSAVNYEIYRTAVLDDANPFSAPLVGTIGQTSFVANFGIDTRSFFRASVGSDWDSDGVPNTVDGQPSNGSVGALTITIDSPLNGESLN